MFSKRIFHKSAKIARSCQLLDFHDKVANGLTFTFNLSVEFVSFHHRGTLASAGVQEDLDDVVEVGFRRAFFGKSRFRRVINAASSISLMNNCCLVAWSIFCAVAKTSKRST